MSGTLDRIAPVVGETLSPVADALAGGPSSTLALLAELGYAPSAVPAPILTLAQPVDGVIGALDDFVDALIAANGDFTSGSVGSSASLLTVQIGVLVEHIATLSDDLRNTTGGVFTQQGAAEELVRRLLELLVVDWFERRTPRIAAVLRAVGAIEWDEVDVVPAGNGKTMVARLRPERLATAIVDPPRLAHDVYKWGLPEFESGVLLQRIADVGVACNRPFLLTGPPDGVATELGIPADDADPALTIPIITDPVGIYAVLIGAPAQGADLPGLAATLEVAGTAVLEIPLTLRTKLVLDGAADLAGGLLFVLRPNKAPDVSFSLGAVTASASAGVTFVVGPQPGDSRVNLLDVADALRLSTTKASLGVRASVSNTAQDIMLDVELDDGKLEIGTGKADGFLAKVLPAGGLIVPLQFHLTWSHAHGVQFEGGAGLVIKPKAHIDLGPLAIEGLELAVMLGTTGVTSSGALDIRLSIGPLNAIVEKIGARANVEFEQGNLGPVNFVLGFKPPSGAGMSIKAGPITGGGYIFFDADNEQYAGILQLGFNQIGLTVIGLLTTRLPDASGPPGATKKGFSLLLIIAVDLPPIQLGYGFALTGVGGLLGIHRTMVVDALRNGVRDGSVNAILFPQDPIKRAAQIISQLRTIFPPAEGRFIFGPMVKIGWGPNAILELSAAVVLELTGPIRLVILGRIQAALPDKKSTVLNLRLDLVGVIDFDRGEVSIDASLVDSRLTAFVLTGDMAVRVGWGASKIFAISAGGFHPRFPAPPGFPVLRRLAISLGDSDNPRLRMEMYFALTANTIQLGAAMDAYVKMDTPLGTFSAAANVTFDALIQFQPFELKAELSASIDILRNNVPLLHAALQATFTGPTPWHAIGYAEFDFLGKRRIAFEATAGEQALQALLRMTAGDVLAKVLEAFSRPDAWGTLPPADANRIVTFGGQAAAGVVVHPLGELSARQRVLPLGKVVDRFGSAVVPGTTFKLNGFQYSAGTTTAAAEELYDDFAPGQFTALTDDEQLARPAFETMRSGGRISFTGTALPDDGKLGVSSTIGYEEAIVDVDPDTGGKSTDAPAGQAATLPDDALAQLVHGGAAAAAETRVSGAAGFRGSDIAVTVLPERYVVAGADTLTPAPGAPGESSAEAHDRLAKRPAAAAPAQVVPAREAA